MSNLPYVSKLIEQVVVEQLRQHMEVKSLHEPCQSAYRKCHSTETALLKINNDLLSALDQNCCALLVMLDLSAAFDTISHSILLERMATTYGVRGDALVWLQSYFSDRSQSVMIDEVMSAAKPLKTGLPQGSLLGPFAFPSYSAPLFAIARNHRVMIHMYADDTQLYLPFQTSDYDSAIKRMEDCLADIRQWMNCNRLKLNDSKTEFMVIGKKASLNKLPAERRIMIGDELIASTEAARNIGVMIDSHLDMSSQINNICRSAYLNIYNIGKIRNYLSKDCTATLVHAFVTSKLDNCNSLLFGCPDYKLKQLQMVQHCSARLIWQKKKFDHITPVLIELHWLPVTARIDYKICLLVHKCIHHTAPLYLQELITPYQPTRRLRSTDSHLIKPPSVKECRQKRTGERTFRFASAQLWNHLPAHLRTCTNLDNFKSLLKTYLFKESYRA